MGRITPALLSQMRCKFAELDTSGDGKLSLEEMKALLSKGNPDMTDESLEKLYRYADADRSGSVDFDEFVDYLYGTPVQYEQVPAGAEPLKAAPWSADDMVAWCNGSLRPLFIPLQAEDVRQIFARVVPRGCDKISRELGADALSLYDKFMCVIANQKGISPKRFSHTILMERHYKAERVAGNVVHGIPDTWNSQVVQGLAEELEEDLSSIVKFIEAGGRMRPYEVVGASATTRWEYSEWLRCCFVGPRCANKLERSIARLAATFVQERLGEDLSVPALQSAFEEGEPIVEQGIAHTWDADCVQEMAEELGMDLHQIANAIQSGRKMKPFEPLKATSTTRWEYSRFLCSMGSESDRLAPQLARRLEKAIARRAVLHAEDLKGPTFEAPPAVESAFDEEDEDPCEYEVGTWGSDIVQQIARESDLSLDPFLQYFEAGLRVRPLDVEGASRSTRWAYVRWLIEEVGLVPEVARKFELVAVRKSVEGVQKRFPGFEVPACLLEGRHARRRRSGTGTYDMAADFSTTGTLDMCPEFSGTGTFDMRVDLDEPKQKPKPHLVANWTADAGPDVSAVFADDAEIAPLTRYLQAGNAMKPYDLDTLTVLARWEYCDWMTSIGFTFRQAQDLEAYIKEQEFAAKAAELGIEFDVPSAFYAYLPRESLGQAEHG